MRTKFFVALLFTFIFIFSFNVSQAQEHDEHHDADHADSHSGHHVYRHHAALFLGATTNFKHETTMFTVGLDYEFRLSFAHDMFGIGFGAEYLTGEHGQEIIFGVPIFFHPIAGLKFNVAPLFAIVETLGHDEGHGHVTEPSWDNYFGFRAGIAYDFHLGRFSISPTLNTDFVDGTVSLVYGIGLGVGF